MKRSELQFDYPENLVATEPSRPSRVLWVEGSEFQEISIPELIAKIPKGDALVVNDTKVLKRRVFAGDLEILFLTTKDQKNWQVLFPSKKYSLGSEIELPLGVKMKLTAKGRPQTVETSEPLLEEYFEKVAELPLPPYIQKARGDRHTVVLDESWYQTAWATKAGSFAAPTASLHFTKEDLEALRKNGVQILRITLHVGLGTFLPVTAEDLNDHEMHEEFFEMSGETATQLQKIRQQGGKIWALGTTTARVLETLPTLKDWQGGASGFTKILLQPGSQFHWVDRLLTNFHQPESTLLALVAGFSGLEKVKSAYRYAITKRFRLFSYGDLSVWVK